MGRAFVASLGTVETVLGQERARQPGFTQSLALLHLLWTATEKEGRGEAVSSPSILHAPYHVGRGRHLTHVPSRPLGL